MKQAAQDHLAQERATAGNGNTSGQHASQPAGRHGNGGSPNLKAEGGVTPTTMPGSTIEAMLQATMALASAVAAMQKNMATKADKDTAQNTAGSYGHDCSEVGKLCSS